MALIRLIIRFTQYWLIWLGGIVVVIALGFRGGVAPMFAGRRGRQQS